MGLKIRNETAHNFSVDSTLPTEIHCGHPPTTVEPLLRPGDVLEIKGSRDVEVTISNTSLIVGSSSLFHELSDESL